MPASPSREDWNTTHSPSADQIGNRSLPLNVSRRIALERLRSYTHTIVRAFASDEPATRVPSRAMRGYSYGAAGSSTLSVRPSLSVRPRSSPDVTLLTGPGPYTHTPFLEIA